MRRLLVEDSERLQRSVGTGLRKAGFAVDISGDGEGGLWYAESHEYDAIILDLMRPKVDGLALLGRLALPVRPGEVWQADITVCRHQRGLALRGGRTRRVQP